MYQVSLPTLSQGLLGCYSQPPASEISMEAFKNVTKQEELVKIID